MEKKLVQKSPYEILIPDKRPAQRATVHSIEDARARRDARKKSLEIAGEVSQTTDREQTVLDSEYIPAEEKKMTPAETREAGMREEKEVEVIAKELFDARMGGKDSETIDAMLVEKGIKPWTPEAEEFMRAWDWEQAEKKFKELAQEREAAVMQANESEPKKRIELQEYQGKYVDAKFKAFGIRLDNLPQELKEEYETLTYGQRLLLAENLQQVTLGRIHEEAQDRYQKGLPEATILKSKLLGKVWQGVSKKYQIAKHEQATAIDIKQGGLAYHGELLKQLVEGTKRTGLDAIEGKDGTLELQYVESHPMMTEPEKQGVKTFNRIATAYGKIPYEWSLDTATSTQRNEYERVAGQFERAKEHILKTEQGIIGDKDTLLFMSDMENKIRLNQFFNTHPDAEKQLESIENDTIWKKAIGNIATERGLYFSAGLATRTFATGMLGAVGFPLAAVGMGGWMARKRAVETLREREVASRHGRKDISNEARSVITAHALSEKIDGLVKKINSEEDKTKKVELLSKLQVRLEYAQHKLNAGTVDFGSVDRRIVNQYGLMDALTMGSSAFAVSDIENGNTSSERKKDVKERLDQFLQFKDAKISKAQKDYLRKQMIYGAGLGIAFFSAGHWAKDVLHGVGPTEAHAQEISKGPEHAGVSAGTAKTVHEAVVPQEPFHTAVDIGARGPEGAFIDELKKHPEIVRRLGIKNIGREAHAAWMEFAKEELKDPEAQRLLSNLGYPKTAGGYGEMMRHIEHGKIALEESGGKLHMRIGEDTEYLRAHPKVSVSGSARPPVGLQIEETEQPPVGLQIEDAEQVSGELPVADNSGKEALERFAKERISNDRIEGILHVSKEITKPSVDVFVGNQFGLDGDEYNAIKGVKVGELLKQIPSRDEGWAIWRGDVVDTQALGGMTVEEAKAVWGEDAIPKIRIDLPHDGIYGVMEFKKHIDLAEHIRGLHPNAAAMQSNVDTFIKAELQSKGLAVSGESVVAEQVVSPIGEIQPVPTVTRVVDVPVVQPIVETIPNSTGFTPEKLKLLNEDIYKSKLPVPKIITQYKVGNITPEDFAQYYGEKVAHAKPSPEMLKNIKTTFSEAAGEINPGRQSLSRTALDVMVKRMQGLK